MKEFIIYPKIVEFDTLKEFSLEYSITETDLILTNHFLYDAYLSTIARKAKTIFYEDYAQGEPTDTLVEAIYQDIIDIPYTRVIGIGGGAIIDVAKLFALQKVSPVVDLFERVFPAIKAHELIIIPTTCGTGSEVTNISILSLTERKTKFGLADTALYADTAILIPELLENLPYKVFATSSIDALIHACESFTSPRATEFTRIYSKEAIKMILNAYKGIRDMGKDFVVKCYPELLLASTYAGIAFSNAGCAAVHALSYPLGAKYHVPHGESNYVFFTDVYRMYMELSPVGEIQIFNAYLSSILNCHIKDCYTSLDNLLGSILEKKSMKSYGVMKKDIPEFVRVVMEKQGRLMRNNYCVLEEKKVKEIYERVYEKEILC